MEYKELTNAELNIELKKLENQYESIKVKVMRMMNEMKSLNDNYLEVKNELKNRKNFF